MSINTNRSSPTQINTSTNSYQMNPKSVGVSFKSISVGPSHVLAIKSNGTLWTWGYNNVGQLGDSTTINKSSPIQLGSGNYIQIHADETYSFALRSDYILFGWGYNQSGQLGTNITIGGYVSSPVQINSTSWNSVSSGSNHLVALKSDNTLWTWGLNTSGQLGNPSYINTSSPTQIGTSSYVSVSAGDNYSLALTNDYKVVAFGDNTYGQLGYTTVSDIKSWTMMSGNDEFTLAIRTDGLLFVWGINTNGQLGLNDRVTRSSPTQLGTNSWSVVSVEGGSSAIRSDGTLWSWGLNSSGQVGDNTSINRSSPVQVAIGGSWSNVSAGSTHKLAIAIDGTLYTWGLGTSGQLGNNAIINRSSPIQISTSSYILISTTDTSSHAITFDGKLFSWGAGTNGRLGLNDTLNRSSPVQVGSSSWSFISATRPGSVFAIKNNLKLYAWGLNTNSSLGTNDALNRSSPVQIHSNDWRTTTNSITGNTGTVNNGFGIQTDYSLWGWGGKSILLGSEFANSSFTYSWTQISSGNSHTVAIRSDGRLFAWGLNINGQVGDNSTLNRSSPIQIGTSQNEGEFWYNVSAIGSRTVAIRCDNTLWVWGLNSGYVGLSDSVNRSSPVQITTAPVTSYTQISAGIDHTLALNDVGQLYIWGNNNAYQLGFNDGVMRSSPVQLSGSFIQISAGNSHSLVVDSDNKLYAWGDNTVGQIGNNSISNKSWVNIYATIVNSSNTIFGLFSDGSLYSWGTDINGTFGTNESGTTRSVPVQIGSSSWSMVAGGRFHVLAIDSVGRLFAWGSNTSGEAGDAYPIGTYSSSPVQLGTDSWSLITAGQGYSAGMKTNGLLYTWGSGSSGVLGFNDAVTRSSPTQLGTDSWLQVSAGTGNVNNLMALRSDYSLFAWGSGANGQLGIGLTTSRSSPVQVQSGFKFKSVASGFGASFAIRDDYTLWSWGGNQQGILGLNIASTVLRSSPVQIGVETYKQISVGSSNVAAVRTNGSLLVWGLGQQGQIGNNTTNNRSSPVQVGTLLYDWVSSAGLTIFTSLANTKLPKLYAWGQVIDNGTGVNRSSPVQVFSSSTSQFVSSPTQIGSSSWSSVSAGASYSLGVNSVGSLYAWGDNTFGQLGVIQSATAVTTPNNGNGGYLRTIDNNLLLWGYNAAGQLGDNTIVAKSTPINVTQLTGVKFNTFAQAKITTNGYTFAIATDNTLWAWGANNAGQLGNNSVIFRSNPIQISASSWTSVAVGLSYTIALKSDNTLWGWGSDYPASGAVSWQSVSAGASHTLILRSDKQLFGFGSNTAGQLGDLTVVAKSSPTVLHAGSLYNSIAAGVNISVGIREDNTLWTWGINTNGGLGLGDTINRSSPVQVGTDINWRNVAVAEHMIVEKTDGTLYAWGINTSGQLGLNDTVSRSSPVQVNGSWTEISTGSNFTLAMKSDNTLYGWGLNNYGQIGNGTTIARSSPVQIAGSWNVISTGLAHAGAITTDNTLYLWGANFAGSINGVGISFIQIGAGTALRSDNAVWVWGTGQTGRLGDGTTVSKSSPVQISGQWISFLNSRIANSTGGGGSGIKLDGTLWGWGDNTYGQIGDNNTINKSSPVQIGTDTNWNRILSRSNQLVYAIKSDYSLWAWGNNLNGQLGLNDTVSRSSPVQIGTDSWVQIALINSVTVLGIKIDNTLWAWGYNNVGQIGDNTTIDKSSPVQLAGSWTQISTGDSTTSYGINTDGKLFAWGNNQYGTIGNNTTTNRSSPVQIGTSSWVQVAGTDLGAAAITVDGKLFTWSFVNGAGVGVSRSSPAQIGTSSWSLVASNNSSMHGVTIDNRFFTWTGAGGGNTAGNNSVAAVYSPVLTVASQTNLAGSLISFSSPVQIAGSWTSIAAGYSHSAAIDTNGILFVWGANNLGQLGLSNTINRSSPTQVGTSSWAIVSAGGSQTVALTNDQPWRNLYTWGAGTLGLIGTNDTLNRSSPVQIGSTWLSAIRSSPSQISSSSDWSIISTADQAAYAIKSNGTLWTWGTGTNGKLGLGDTISRSSPTQIGSSSWTQIAGGRAFVAGITTDGTLYAWGANPQGQLAQGDTINRSNPVQITGSYTYVSSGESFVVAIKSDGDTWAWGLGTSGQLGGLDLISRSSPVQVDTIVTFNTVTAGSVTSYGLKDSTVYAWGAGTSGALGDGTTVTKLSPIVVTSIWYNNDYAQSSPTQVGADLSWSIVAAGASTSMALESTGELFTWGNNTVGQVGDNTTISRSSIVQIGTSSFTIISAGGVNSYAIKSTTNLLFGWGNAGTLGDNTIVAKSSPVQVFTTTNLNPVIPIKLSTFAGSSYTQVQSTSSAVTVTASNGLLYAWGNNNNGKLGILSINVTASSPILIGGQAQPYNGSPMEVDSNSYTQISAGYRHALAIKDDSTLYGWGNFAGTAPAINAYSWKKVVAGGTHFIAIRGDNTLWTWGSNLFGQLGTNDTVSRSVPVQISGTYIDVTAGYFHSAAIATENNLYTWGTNNAGQLGIGNSISRSSPVQVGTTLITSPTAYSTSFNGTSQYLTLSSNSLFEISSAFTVEAWIYVTDTSRSMGIVGYHLISGAPNEGGWVLSTSAGGILAFNTYLYGSGAKTNITGSGIIANIWQHVAFSYDGTSIKLFINGTNVASGSLGAIGYLNATLNIGRWNYTTPRYFSGYISNVRIVKGTVLYTTNFTPSATPLTAITNTSLLTCQNKTFIDNSSNGFTITVNGNAIAGQLESPFVGYSVVFNGSNQYLNVAANSAFAFDTGNWTIECWFYWNGTIPANTNQYTLISNQVSSDNNTWDLQWYNSTFRWAHWSGGEIITAPATLIGNSWYHIAVTRSSGTGTIWLNGISIGTASVTGNYSTQAAVKLGWNGFNNYWNGNISNVRLVKGTAMYTSNFTPAAYNLANVSGTSLLTCQSSTIVDNSSNNFTITNNGTALTTYTETPITYNSNGLLFGGTTSDYLTIPSNASLSLTGDFTIEAWIYFTSAPSATEATVIHNASQGTYASTGTWVIAWLNGGFFISHKAAGGVARCNTNSLGSVQINTWYHIAFTRTLLSGASYTLRSFLNGTFAGDANTTEVFSGSYGLIIGNQWLTNTAIAYPFPGYISNLRIINGTSLYSSNTNFTPSTTPLTAITNTVLLTCQNPAAIDASSLVNPITTNGSVTETPSGITPFTNYLASTSGFSKIVAGTSHSIALGTDKKLYVWGGNGVGQLGTNNLTTVFAPTQITPTLFYNDITASGNNSGAIDSNQNLYTWGSNTNGQLGIGVTTNRSSPTQLGSFTWSTVVAVGPISAGVDCTIAIRNDGTLWSWGGNTNGQLGNTTTISRSSPIQVGSEFWSTLYDSGNNQGSIIAQKSNGSLFVWGVNDLGQLGINATTNRSSPVQLSTSFNFANSGAIGSTTGAFFDVTGQLYTAGRGTSGELGDGNIAASQARSTPVQIAIYKLSSPIQLSSTSWSQISAGNDLSYIVDTHGALYAWGLNTSYQTGIGTGETIVSSPTQIGTVINSATAGSTTGGYIKNV